MNKQQFAMIAMILNGKNIYLFNFNYFFYNLTPFLVHWIVIAPIKVCPF
jgi:hypothetical protein